MSKRMTGPLDATHCDSVCGHGRSGFHEVDFSLHYKTATSCLGAK